MKKTAFSRNFQAIALAGLAVGLSALEVQAETPKAKTEAKGCKGTSSCKGVKVDSAAKSNDLVCAGNGKCGGVAEAKAAPADSAKARILSAKTEKDFKKACTEAGRKVEKATCAGQNSCAGIYLIKGKTMEVSCKGQAVCMGLKCAA